MYYLLIVIHITPHVRYSRSCEYHHTPYPEEMVGREPQDRTSELFIADGDNTAIRKLIGIFQACQCWRQRSASHVQSPWRHSIVSF